MASVGVHPLRVQLRGRGPARRPTGARSSGSAATRRTRRRRATRARRRCGSTTTRTAAAIGCFTRCAAAPTARSRRSTGTPRSARWPRGSAPFATPRRRHHLLLRRRRAGEPPRRRRTARPRRRARRSVPLERLAQEKTGEIWVSGRMFGAPCAPTSSTARWPCSSARTRGFATHPPRPHDAQGDRRGPGTAR